MAVLMEFMKAQIAKTFPGYGAGEPFPGHVAKVDVRGTDDKPFKIHYEDGDKEWVTLAELVQILVDPDLKAKAQQFLYQGVPKDPEPPKAAAGGGRKRTQPEAAPQAAPPAAAGAKKPRAAAAAAAAPAAAAEPPAPASGAARKAGKAHQQPAALDAAGVGLSGGSKPSASTGKAAAGAAGAAGAAAGGDSAAVSPSEVDGLIRDVCKAADQHASADRQWGKSEAAIIRLTYKGSGSAVLPRMSQGLITANEASFTVYSSPRGSKAKSYRAEAEEVLKRLSGQLQSATAYLSSRGGGGKLEKSSLTKVRVHLRNVQEGLPDFKAAWDAWVEAGSLPLLTILQGSGPWSDADIVLEADAHINPALH